MPPLVSVLMAVFNGADYLPTAIDSVLSQRMGDLELVIGDNASTDASEQIARDYAQRDRRVVYFRNAANYGATANWNLCHQHSDSESRYWAFLASDDWWDPSYLARMSEIAESDPSLTFVHCDMLRTDATGKPIGRYSDIFKQTPGPGVHRAVRPLYHGCYINIMAALVNRRRQEKVYPVANILEPTLTFTPDFHLWLQLLNRGATAYYLAESLAYYRKHDGAMTMPANNVRRLREEVAIFRDKLRDVCPPELDDLRREALQDRLASLGFELLRHQQVAEAVLPLREGLRLASRRRLDLPVANAIASLPVAAAWRAKLWNATVATSRALGRASV
jgi:glycosyltransferase involved in cell wall biosynthesis